MSVSSHDRAEAPIGLQPTTTEDLATLRSWEQDGDTRGWLGDTSLGWHERALTDPDQRHLVAVRDARPVGFVVLAGLERSDHLIELRRIVVSPVERGNGVGRALLRAAVARAAQHDSGATLWLDVKDDNSRAQALYLSEGFAFIAPPAHLGTPPADLLFMERLPSVL